LCFLEAQPDAGIDIEAKQQIASTRKKSIGGLSPPKKQSALALCKPWFRPKAQRMTL